MNGKRVVLAVINGSPSTSSNLFQAATMNRSYRTNVTNDNPNVWIPPRRTSGLFLCVCQTDVQTCSTSSGISMFREGPLHLATSLCHCTPSKPHSTSMVNLDQLSSFDKDMLEHVELRVSQFEHSLQRLQNLPRTGQGMLFHGFPWFSMVFRMMALQFLLVRFLVPPTSASGPFTSEDVSGATTLTLSSSL